MTTPLILNDWGQIQPDLIHQQQVEMANPQRPKKIVSDFLMPQYRKRLIPANMKYKKEDLYDHNLQLKVDLNYTKEDNLRLKTRMSQLVQQLRGRDKLIEELYKSAYITANGNQASQNLPGRDSLMLISL